MKSLFKILSGGTKKGKKEAVTEQPASPQFDPEKVYPKLLIPNPDRFEEEEIYILKYKHGKLDSMKENQLQLRAYAVELVNDAQVLVHAFIRHSVRAEIQLEDASIVLRDESGKSLCKKTFLLKGLGALPPLTSVPYTFMFDISSLSNEQKQNTEKWSIGFEILMPHQLVYDPSWENSLTDEQRNYFQTIFDQNPQAAEDELNFMLINAQKADGNIHVTVMIQNGKKQNVEISQLPLLLQNENGQTIAQGTFKMEKFAVPANTSKPWVFVFPKETILMDSSLDKVKLALAQ